MFKRYNYNKIILIKTTFGSSSVVEVEKIKIPLYSASFEEKEEIQKQSTTKRNLFTTAYQRSRGRGFRDCIPALLTSLGLSTL